MLLRWSQFHQKVSSVALVVLTLWLSGLGCGMCYIRDVAASVCESTPAAQPTPSVNSPEVSQESCQKEEADCCKKRVSKPATKPASSTTEPSISKAKSATMRLQILPTSSVVTCSLLPKHIPGLIVAPQSSNNLEIEAPPVHATFAASAQTCEPQFFRPILPQNRGGTYLRCCVFLI